MGYPLHGQDISLDVTPNQARLGWAVGWKKEAFWGRDVLLAEKEAGPKRRLRGLVAVGRGIPRPGMGVSLIPDVPLGEITSGTFSPTLKKGIGLALVPTFVAPRGRGRRRRPRSPRDLPERQAAVRRHLRPRVVSRRLAHVNLPEQPPTFRSSVQPERRWWWRLEDAPGDEVAVAEEYAGQRFPSQADAESWVGEMWAELAGFGVDAVTLFEDDRRGLRPDVAARLSRRGVPVPDPQQTRRDHLGVHGRAHARARHRAA